MPRRYDTREIRDTVGALDRAGVAVREILRRLNEGEAGLDYKVPIKSRQVYDYRKQYREENGPPVKHVPSDKTLESISSLKARLVELMGREITVLERRRAGQLKPHEITKARDILRILDDFERRERRTVMGGRDKDISFAPREEPKPSSALARVAEQMATGERDSAPPGRPDGPPTPEQRTEALAVGGRERSEDGAAGGGGAGSSSSNARAEGHPRYTREGYPPVDSGPHRRTQASEHLA